MYNNYVKFLELCLIFYLILQQSIRNLSAAAQRCLHWQHRPLRRPLPLKTGTTWQVQRAQFVLQLLIVILKACLLTCCHPSLVNPFWLKFIKFFSAMHSPFVWNSSSSSQQCIGLEKQDASVRNDHDTCLRNCFGPFQFVQFMCRKPFLNEQENYWFSNTYGLV